MSVDLTKMVEGIDRVCVYSARLSDTFLRIERYGAMRHNFLRYSGIYCITSGILRRDIYYGLSIRISALAIVNARHSYAISLLLFATI